MWIKNGMNCVIKKIKIFALSKIEINFFYSVEYLNEQFNIEIISEKKTTIITNVSISLLLGTKYSRDM